MPRHTLVLIAASLVALSGCKGSISLAPGSGAPEGARTELDEQLEKLPPAVVPPPSDEIFAFLPRRVRRLTNAELERSISEMVGEDVDIVGRFPDDARQRYFRLNDQQIVDPLWASALSDVASEVADDAAEGGFAGIVTCTERDRACAERSVRAFAERAWRRPVEADEVTSMMDLFELGNTSGGFDTGMAWVIEGVLQAPGFVYTTELGDSRTDAGTLVLSPWEVAAQLAFVTTGNPPDDALLAAAADGSILTGEVRAQHARRLLDTPEGRVQVRELIMQWLGLDKLSQISKDANEYPEFMDLQGAIIQEAEDFLDDLVASGGGVEELLGASHTIVEDQRLAQFYGLGGTGRQDLSGTPRRGILSQAGFLAAHSNTSDSGPVERGVTVIERVLCVELLTPGELNIQVVPPEPDQNATTRERFAAHVADPMCAGCHAGIDGVGFAFEHFDPVGRLRQQDNNKPVDTSGELLFSEVQGAYPSSLEMIQAIAPTETARKCFARNVFGFASARDDDEVVHSFETLWASEAPATDRLDDALVVFIASDLFIHRSPE